MPRNRLFFETYSTPLTAVTFVLIFLGCVALVKCDQAASKKCPQTMIETIAASELPPQPLPEPDPYEKVMRSYLQKYHRQGRDVFWLRGEESPADHMKLMTQWEPLFRTLLAKYQDVSPLSTRLYAQFKDFWVSEFTRGISRLTFTDEKSAPAQNQLEVSIVPESEWLVHGRKTLPSSLYYRQDWGAVMMTAIQRPTVITAALFYHEIGHALRHRVDKASSSTAAVMSNDWVVEELEMHDLETAIMDKGADGKFLKLINEIVARAGGAESPVEVLNKVTDADLDAYDRMFDLQDAGQEVIASTTAQFYLTLLLRHAESFILRKFGNDPDKLLHYQIEMYGLARRLI